MTKEQYKELRILEKENEEIFTIIMVNFLEDITIVNEKNCSVKLDYSKNIEITQEILRDYCNNDFRFLINLVETFIKELTGVEFRSSKTKIIK